MQLVAITALPQTLPQAASDLERRVGDLEQKMRLLDPAFRPRSEMILAERLKVLEAKIEELVLARAVVAPSPVDVAVTAPPAVPIVGLPLQPVTISGDYQKSADTEMRLPVAGYMDFHVNRDAGSPYMPDFHRFVLLFGHSFSDRIKFWSELEVEHALVVGGLESGEVALEQAFLDFLITPKFNIRAGMMLTPVGIVNERHEPPSFNGVERPFVETVIIPTTWRELGFGFTGDLGKGFRYRTYLTSALDGSLFDAERGISNGKASGLNASMRNPALVGRLEYSGVRRMTLGTSFYRGSAGYNAPGVNAGVKIFNVDGRFSYRRADFRALYANTWVSKAGDLNLHIQRQVGSNPNIANQMRGYYAETGFHLLPRRYRNDLIAFGRYEVYNTQQAMPEGYLPLLQFNRSSWISGLTYKPVPDVAIKFDYVVNRNASQVVRAINGINLGIGWWF